MKAIVCVTLVSILLLNACPAAFGQSQKEIMTNASVIGLVKAGLGEAVIIQKIRRSEPKFDTSDAGLKQLKAAGVSDNIIMEMMNSGVTVANAPPSPTSDPGVGISSNPTDPKSSHEPGIYIMSKDKLTELNPTVFQGTKMSWWRRAVDPTGLYKSKWRAVVNGSSANTQISETRPEFYFYFDKSTNPTYASWWWFWTATSPAEFTMVRMDQKSKTREAVLGEFNSYKMSTGAPDKDIIEFSFEKIRPGAFKVVPKTNLAPGEYCFYYGATPQGLGFAGGKLFDFGVVK